MALEQKRVHNINIGMLIAHEANMVDKSITVESNDEILREQFSHLFVLDEDGAQVNIKLV